MVLTLPVTFLLRQLRALPAQAACNCHPMPLYRGWVVVVLPGGLPFTWPSPAAS